MKYSTQLKVRYNILLFISSVMMLPIPIFISDRIIALFILALSALIIIYNQTYHTITCTYNNSICIDSSNIEIWKFIDILSKGRDTLSIYIDNDKIYISSCIYNINIDYNKYNYRLIKKILTKLDSSGVDSSKLDSR